LLPLPLLGRLLDGLVSCAAAASRGEEMDFLERELHVRLPDDGIVDGGEVQLFFMTSELHRMNRVGI